MIWSKAKCIGVTAPKLRFKWKEKAEGASMRHEMSNRLVSSSVDLSCEYKNLYSVTDYEPRKIIGYKFPMSGTHFPFPFDFFFPFVSASSIGS
jgi:hypothetical protein